MKFLLSSLLFLMLAHPVQEDQNKYLLIYTALVKPNLFGGSMVLTGTTGNIQYNGGAGQYSLNSSYYDSRNQVFSSLEEAQNFVHQHTVHYLDNSRTEPWDFTITEITGFYKLRRLDTQKTQVGTHTEYVQTTTDIQIPSYEWSINE